MQDTNQLAVDAMRGAIQRIHDEGGSLRDAIAAMAAIYCTTALRVGMEPEHALGMIAWALQQLENGPDAMFHPAAGCA